MNMNEIQLRYGMNPHQTPARVFAKKDALPIKVLSGQPGFINLLDAMNSWQLVRELKKALNLPAAASFKHVSPSGAAVGIPLSESLKKACSVHDLELSPLACAYARARGVDRVCSFGDWVALSDTVDVSTAQLLSREVSDGIIAPGYELEALSMLSKKKKGKYVVIEIDPAYEPQDMETKEVFGITFEQKRNNRAINLSVIQNIVTENKAFPDTAKRDMIVALVTLKYTQSNSVCFAVDGQAIGVGAGQQSRIHCTRLAGSKAETWYLRQHPAALGLKFKEGMGRPEQGNAIDLYLRDDLTSAEQDAWEKCFVEVPKKLTPKEKKDWLKGLKNVVLGSDGFIPFRDNIDRAYQSGVSYVAQPGGSLRDEDIIKVCNEYGMVMVFTNLRLFHH